MWRGALNGSAVSEPSSKGWIKAPRRYGMIAKVMSAVIPDRSGTARAASFELMFNPSADLITVVRQFVENFYLRVLGDADLSSRVALTTHELLENAAKYSTDGEVRLFVQIDTARGLALVRTINRAEPEQIERLRADFQEIAAAPDVNEYYAKMLRRSAERRSGSGGIGLARIWAETDMAMRLVVHEDEVEIHAHGPIDPKR